MSKEEKPEIVQNYYLVKLNGREVIDYAETIREAVEKWYKHNKEPIIVKPVTWKTNFEDITPPTQSDNSKQALSQNKTGGSDEQL